MNEQEMSDLFERARKGDTSVLSMPECASIRNRNGQTPLHVLAMKGVALANSNGGKPFLPWNMKRHTKNGMG